MAMMKNTGMLWIGQIPVDWELGKVKYAFNRRALNIGIIETFDVVR